MHKTFENLFAAFKIIAFELVAAISLKNEKNTCVRPSKF